MPIHPKGSAVVDLNTIAELASLLHLDLSYSHGMRDVTPLSRLTLLQTLNLHYCIMITTGFAALMGCGSIRDLDISFCKSVPSQDLANLAAWTQLERLVMPDRSYRRRGLPVAGWLPPLLTC